MKDMSGEKAASGGVFSEAAPELLESHLKHLLEETGLDLDVIRERKYRSIVCKAELGRFGFAPAQQRVPGLLIPLWGVDGQPAGYQFRSDNPRTNTQGKTVKYELPAGSSNRLDCPPRCQKALGIPKVPLWITEGSKKADALAGHGACAISVTGVWGFKGKNEFGGVTLLADWDHIVLKDRQVYLAFDSDIATKEPVKKALSHIAEHLRRKDASLHIVQLPQLEGQQKTGIDDYLLKHSLADAEKLVGEFKLEEEDKERYVSGFVLRDGTVGEMVVDEDERYFMVSVNGAVRKAYQHETPKVTYLPTQDMLVGHVVHFAPTAAPYDSQARLFSEIQRFIHYYLELPADFEEIVALYVLLSWVYEFAPSIPYLRVIGDWGTGKTRFLQVVGSICFRPMFASGATTPSPIFRILEQFRGTLVLDEADFKDSTAWAEMVKLLNNGYRPGMPVLRADKENGKWFPRGYQVFGPKLLSTRFPFSDEALESRCLTSEMMPLTRDDIPRVLPASFDKEVGTLRSKLLTFRLHNLCRLRGKTFGNELLEPNLQPRLQEILIPMKAMLNGDHAMAEALGSFVHRLQESLYARRRESDAGRVLAAMIELVGEGGELTSRSIATRANRLDEEASELTAERVGHLTKRLGFAKDRVGKGRQRLIRWEPERAQRIASMYGMKQDIPVSPEKPSAPSEPSALDTNSADGFEDGLVNRPPAEAKSPDLADGLAEPLTNRPPSPKAKPNREADSADGSDGLGGYKRGIDIDYGQEESSVRVK
ncbi:protein of unknown function (DUF3854) [Dehalogenimonas alkenigignens]|uniref:DUF3854 domain-containing protein n=2 Tax=Dehalogenimonas alkenigignens TaxID=1217799 RepID=A0A0W0GKD7_9CHLR|nr:protein of unknown function (DUF3854) [Dehalogenimonas alkenigignens]